MPVSTCFNLMLTLQARGYLYEVGKRNRTALGGFAGRAASRTASHAGSCIHANQAIRKPCQLDSVFLNALCHAHHEVALTIPSSRFVFGMATTST